jgi:transposase InsO family protein
MVRGGRAHGVAFEDLPEDVQVAYLHRAHAVRPEDGADDALWSAFARKSAKVRAAAERALAAVQAIEAKHKAGKSYREATDEVSSDTGYSVSTLYDLRKKVRGAAPADWLPILAADYKGGGRPADPWEDGWRHFLSFLKHAAPQTPLTVAYRETDREAKAKGWAWPSYGTVHNRWRALPKGERALIRSGTEALARAYPSQQRTVAHLQAMQVVNLDGRKADFFVRWEDGTISRPIVIALQDVHSRLILGHRFSKTEDADTTKALLLDVFDHFGLFDELVTDNGRAFASKKIAGGAGRPFRGKRDDDEVSGLLALCGVRVRFAIPRHGQSKPIERGFRDVAMGIDTRPEFKGAYCGNRPDAKPEDFSGNPVDIAVAREVYARELDHHNTQTGRRTEMAKGTLSFREVFEASYATRPDRKLAAAQRYFFMHDVAYLKPNKTTGALKKDGFEYWSRDHQDILVQHANATVAVYFDPNNRSNPVTVLDAEGRMLVERLPCLVRGRFDSTEDARTHARAKAQYKRAAKQKVAAMNLMSDAELTARARETRAVETPDPPTPDTTVSRPVFGALPAPASLDPDDGARVLDMPTRRQKEEFAAHYAENMKRLKEYREAEGA